MTMISLTVALAATAVILLVKPPHPGGTASAGDSGAEPALASAYPKARVVAVEGPEGYAPLFFFDDKRSAGTVETADGQTVLLVAGREVRRVAKALMAEFAGFVADGDRLVWLEMTLDPQGRAVSRLWAVEGTAPARMITADTGDVALFDKRDDLVLHDGKVSWVAAAPGEPPATEIRTVAIGGGKVSVERREGAFSFTGWPWLTTVNLGQNGPIQLLNVVSGEQLSVPVRPGELVSCSPSWCRAIIIGGGPGSTVIELQKPKETNRSRAVSGAVAAALVDVALLDRFEVYSYQGGRLVLYDVESRKTVVVAKSGVAQVVSRGSVLWWATGDAEATAWHALDLRTLINQ